MSWSIMDKPIVRQKYPGQGTFTWFLRWFFGYINFVISNQITDLGEVTVIMSPLFKIKA